MQVNKKSEHSASSTVMVCPDINDKSEVNLEFIFRCDVGISHSEDLVSFCIVDVRLY